MRIYSKLSKKDYLYNLRSNMSHWPTFWQECFTGVTLGRFFYVAHHAGFQWDRRYSNQKNWAMGFVSENEGGCMVRCITMRGYTDPVTVIGMFLLFWFIGRIGYSEIPQTATIWISVVVAVLTALASAFASLITERGEASYEQLQDLLYDPAPTWVS